MREIAAVAADALTAEGHQNKIYNLTDPEEVTHHQMAPIYRKYWAKLLRLQMCRRAQCYRDCYLPQWMAEGLIEDYAHYARGEAGVITNDIQNVTGEPPYDFKTFANDYKTAFS